MMPTAASTVILLLLLVPWPVLNALQSNSGRSQTSKNSVNYLNDLYPSETDAHLYQSNSSLCKACHRALPKRLCQSQPFCSSSTVAKPQSDSATADRDERAKKLTLHTDRTWEHVSGDDWNWRLGSLRSLMKRKTKQSNWRIGDLCMECEAVASDLQEIYSDPKMQNYLVDEALKLCSYIEYTFPACADSIDIAAPSFFEWLELSTTLEMCRTFCTEVQVKKARKQLALRLKHFSDDFYCNDCILFVHDVQYFFSNTEQREAAYIDLMDRYCKQLESGWPSCREFLAENFDPVVDYLLRIPAQIPCKLFKFCSDQNADLSEQPVSQADSVANFMDDSALIDLTLSNVNPRNSVVKSFKQIHDSVTQDGCGSCQAFMSVVQVECNSSAAVYFVVQSLQAGCQFLRYTFPQCSNWVSSFIPPLINQFLSSSVLSVCSTVFGMCQASAIHSTVLQTSEPAANDNCNICLTFVSDMETFYVEPTQQPKLQQLLLDLCAYIGSYWSQCSTLMHAYFPMIVQSMQDVSPATFCGLMQFCPTTAQ